MAVKTEVPAKADALTQTTEAATSIATAPVVLPEYTADMIETPKGLMLVRRSPSLFIRDMEAAGLTQQYFEVSDNSLDEMVLLLPHGNTGFCKTTLCRDAARGTYQIIVRDNGRGIPHGDRGAKFTEVVTVPSASSKAGDGAAYFSSAGQFGVGLKVGTGMSTHALAMSSRDGQTAALAVELGQHPDLPTIVKPQCFPTGTVIIYEPDPSIFNGIDVYAYSEYTRIIERLCQYVFFIRYNFEFRISDTPLDPAIWTASPQEATRIMMAAEEAAPVVWSTQMYDEAAWLKRYWELNRQITWTHSFQGNTDGNLSGYEVRLYYTKGDNERRLFSLINNVPQTVAKSNQFSVLSDVLYETIAKRIKDPKVHDFFLSHYKLPLHLAVNVFYKKAKLSGTTKDAFYWLPFREEYRKELEAHFRSAAGVAGIDSLMEFLEEDIQAKFTAYIQNNSSGSKKGTPWYMQLKDPGAFDDCRRPCDHAELFIVEGKSAGKINTHNKSFQAILRFRGKPKNYLKVTDNRTEIINAMMTDKGCIYYHDLFKVLGYDPYRPSLQGLNFVRCLITTDGDPDGRHIAAILISNLYAVAPELVEMGLFGVVSAPFLEVMLANSKQETANQHRMFVRSAVDLEEWWAKTLYFNTYNIDVVYRNGVRKTLTENEFATLAIYVLRIGKLLESLETELSIPAAILEGLAWCSYFLTPTTMNTDVIREKAGLDAVSYSADTNVMTLSIDGADYTIPLYNLADRLRATVTPALRNLDWGQVEIYITSKYTKLIESQRVSPLDLCRRLLRTNDLVRSKTLKGLGSMDPVDTARSCMNPNYRRVYNITTPGDVNRIFDLMGKNTAARKRLSDADIIE